MISLAILAVDIRHGSSTHSQHYSSVCGCWMDRREHVCVSRYNCI